MSSGAAERSIVKIGSELFAVHIPHGVGTRLDWKAVHLSQIHLYFEYDAAIRCGRPHKREPQGYEEFCAAHNHFVGNGKGGRFAYLAPPESNPAGER